jgi:2-polyprenyl-6-methoxyphenol hydroxylase-like FAD-dependent oxidoreductase
MYFASRALIERLVRDRVAACEGVMLAGGCQVTEPSVRDGDGTVTGVEVLVDGRREQVEADLVVDATGRATRMPAWLERLGYAPPPIDEVGVDLAYVTCQLKRPAGDRRAMVVLPDVPRARGGGLFPIEGPRWLLTHFGLHGQHPTPDVNGLRAFAAGLPVDLFAELLEEQPLAAPDIARYRFPTQRRDRYDKLKAFPDGLLAVGDAVASFNPIYGQGMSVAALEALVLHHVLAEHGRQAGLARRFYARSAPLVEHAWNLAAGGDFQFAQTRGRKPPGTDLINRYVHRLHRTAHTDGRLTDAFARVASMERRPTSLFHPQVAWRVLRPHRGTRSRAAPTP